MGQKHRERTFGAVSERINYASMQKYEVKKWKFGVSEHVYGKVVGVVCPCKGLDKYTPWLGGLEKS